LYRNDEAEFPGAIDLLQKIREDRKKQHEEIDKIYDNAIKAQSNGFNIRGIF